MRDYEYLDIAISRARVCGAEQSTPLLHVQAIESTVSASSLRAHRGSRAGWSQDGSMTALAETLAPNPACVPLQHDTVHIILLESPDNLRPKP